jgi:transcription elongation factor Elf1
MKTRRMVSMRLPERTIAGLRLLARRHGSQSDAVVELVDDAFGCPTCGNRDMDWLPFDEDGETVTCGKCGRTYDPSEVTA